MRTILGIILLFVSFIPATLGQQSTPADKSPTAAAAQQTYEVKIEFNRRVRMHIIKDTGLDVQKR